jgi:hypothetical protein
MYAYVDIKSADFAIYSYALYFFFNLTCIYYIIQIKENYSQNPNLKLFNLFRRNKKKRQQKESIFSNKKNKQVL